MTRAATFGPIPRAARGFAPAWLLALACALAAAGCGTPAPPPAADEAHHDDHGHEDEHAAEGVVELDPRAVERGGIVAADAGPREIRVVIETPGEIRLNAEKVVQVRPRFPGILRELSVRLGDEVREGQPFAVVHSNESLTDYAIAAPAGGTIVSRDVSAGQAVDHETVLATIADLGTVWVDFALYPQIAGRVRVGQPVEIRSTAGDPREASGRIAYVGPMLEQDTRVAYGRVVLPNPRDEWTPGLFVTVAVTIDRARVDVAVPEQAIVRMAEGPAVFRADGATFRLQPVVPGRSDGQWTEIREGLEAGASVVVENAFLLKAELGKSEAAHDH